MKLNKTELLAAKKLLALSSDEVETVFKIFGDIDSELKQDQLDGLKLLLELDAEEQKQVITLCENLKDIPGVVEETGDDPEDDKKAKEIQEAQAKRHPRLVRKKKTEKYHALHKPGNISKNAARIGRLLLKKKSTARKKKNEQDKTYHNSKKAVTWEDMKLIAPPAKNWPESLMKPFSVGSKFLVTPNGLQLPPGYADRMLYGMVKYDIGDSDVSTVKKSYKWAYDTDRAVTHAGLMAWRPPIIMPDVTSMDSARKYGRFTMKQRISLSYHLWHFIFRKKRTTVGELEDSGQLKLSSGGIENILTCKCIPTVMTLQAVSEFTNMSINVLLGLELNVTRSDYDKKLYDYMKDLI